MTGGVLAGIAFVVSGGLELKLAVSISFPFSISHTKVYIYILYIHIYTCDYFTENISSTSRVRNDAC